MTDTMNQTTDDTDQEDTQQPIAATAPETPVPVVVQPEKTLPQIITSDAPKTVAITEKPADPIKAPECAEYLVWGGAVILIAAVFYYLLCRTAASAVEPPVVHQSPAKPSEPEEEQTKV